MSLITYLTRIHFAERALEDALGAELARISVTRPFVLIDAEGQAGEGAEVLSDAIPRRCSPVWIKGTGQAALSATQTRDETDLQLPAVRQALRENACDVVLAFGGAQALSFGRKVAAATALPLIAVPTTTADIGLSTGVSASSPFNAQQAMPTAILCDPTLTYGMGPRRTAAYGFDALTHCIEAFLAPGHNPPADGIAQEGIHRASLNLEQAVQDGRSPEARREMMAAALNGALAAQKGLGGIEALARAIENESGGAMPHGHIHASVLPQVLGFNAPAVGDRYARIAVAMTAYPCRDPIPALAEFAARIGLPDRLRHLGLDPAALRRAATRAAADPAAQTNPRHATQEDYFALLTRAI